MKRQVTHQQSIASDPNTVWNIITDIAGAAQVISGIEEIKIIKKPPEGILGLCWKETRILFGKRAVETLRVVAVVPGESYVVEADNHGTKYESCMRIIPEKDGCILQMTFTARAQSLSAKIMSKMMWPLMRKSMDKMIQQDLHDIKAHAQQLTSP